MQDLTARYGSYVTIAITTPPDQAEAACSIVQSLSANSRLVYSLGGAQRFELPLHEVTVDTIFRRMEEVKIR